MATARNFDVVSDMLQVNVICKYSYELCNVLFANIKEIILVIITILNINQTVIALKFQKIRTVTGLT
jgi:hypothetical protein